MVLAKRSFSVNLLFGLVLLSFAETECADSQMKSAKGKDTAIVYSTYVNSKFGFSVAYPASYKQKEPSSEGNYETEILPDSDEGIDLVSPDWDVEIVAKGYNSHGVTAKDEYNETLSRHPNAAYKVQKENWFVVSWVDDDNPGKDPEIVYLKGVIGKGSANILKVRYPLKSKAKCNAMVTQISKSFKTPNVDQSF